MLLVGLFLAARAYRYAATFADKTAALTAVSIIVVYLVYCYGDLGLGTWTSVFTVAPAFAIASKLAVTTGAWPSKQRVSLDPLSPGERWRTGAVQSRG